MVNYRSNPKLSTGISMKKSVLFLSKIKGVHSAMAEALLRRIDSGNFEAVTAPIRADEIHPLTVEAMKEVGVDVLEKSLAVPDDFRNGVFDFVITLCDRAKLEVVEFQGGEQILWHFDNPLTVRDPERRVTAFRTLRDQIAQRLHLFVLVQARSERAA